LAWNLFVRMPDRQHWWNLDVDALTGAILAQTDWILNDSYRVFALPLEDPDGGPRSDEVDPADAIASPFAWHDTNGAAGAETSDSSGNNVTAQEDANGNNGTGTRAPGGVGLVFDAPLDLGQPPSASQNAAITNLFYWNNILHDIHHVYGFDEASGNFQVNNYGNGGMGGDPVLADAQDGSGINNATFSRAPEGTSPRMQMFLFEFPGVKINAPSAIVQAIGGGAAEFGPTISLTGITDDVGQSPPLDACSALSDPAAVSGKIALIERGTCPFVQKVANAQAAGAVAALISNNVGDEVILMGGTDASIVIPSMFIGQSHGEMLAAELGNGLNVTLSAEVQRDGDLDNGIIAHEYGHGVSIRLSGGPSNVGCLSLAQPRGMGEGWGDWWGLMLTATAQDEGPEARGIGAYALGEGPMGPGIRNFPYSTDLFIDPQTLSSIDGTNQPHGVGEIWAQALWEVNWVLVGEHGYDPDLYAGTGGNNLALQLVMDGLKLQGCEPTFLEARDAIFQADLVANAGANECLLWQAFAKRGMGEDADDTGNPRRTRATDGFTVPAGCEPVCGNSRVDLGEECDDGGTTGADGCSAGCQVETFVPLFGTAQGGSVSITVDGVIIEVTTTPGQSAADVLAALAAAINADPTLQGLGISAAVFESELVTSGEVTDLTITDAGLSEEPIVTQHVPALGAQGVAILSALLALIGARTLRRGLMGTSSPCSRWHRL
jgi:cysteine-rich repeat protein